MSATATELAGLFGKGLTEEQRERAAGLLDTFVSAKVKERTAETIADRVEVQVEKTVMARSKDLATKGDLQKIEDRVDRLDSRMVSGFIAVLLGIIALMATMVWGFQGLREQQGNAPVSRNP